eukprot:TRINITY_DN70477_c0_g1_i1.p1 TRINITY_DN70477_c0_g1~~TRINITY_DN70477_c0_g1_i1.p1  ORF type:complete len:252 (+),score=24.16 TRINITY_DN70477_c0_g1_i1:132-887(+)
MLIFTCCSVKHASWMLASVIFAVVGERVDFRLLDDSEAEEILTAAETNVHVSNSTTDLSPPVVARGIHSAEAIQNTTAERSTPMAGANAPREAFLRQTTRRSVDDAPNTTSEGATPMATPSVHVAALLDGSTQHFSQAGQHLTGGESSPMTTQRIRHVSLLDQSSRQSARAKGGIKLRHRQRHRFRQNGHSGFHGEFSGHFDGNFEGVMNGQFDGIFSGEFDDHIHTGEPDHPTEHKGGGKLGGKRDEHGS